MLLSKERAQQQALRHAALTGAPVQVFQELLKPQQLKPEARKSSSFFKLTDWKLSKSASTPACQLDFIYEDDGGGTILHYLCCGTSMWHLFQEAITSGPDVRLKRWQQSAKSTAPNRVKALAWFLDPEQSDLWPSLPMGFVTHRCFNVLHCCLLNGGCTEALLLLLEKMPPGMPKPDVSLEDAGGRTPLHWACATHNWEAARILIRHSAIRIGPDLRAADNKVALALSPPPLAPALPSYASTVQALPAPLRWFYEKVQVLQQLMPFTVSMLSWQLTTLVGLLVTWFVPPGNACISAMEAQVAACVRGMGHCARSSAQRSPNLQGLSAGNATASPCLHEKGTGLVSEETQFAGFRHLGDLEGEEVTLRQGSTSAAQEKPGNAGLGQQGASVLRRVQTGGVDGWFGCSLEGWPEYRVLDAADAVVEQAQAEEARIAEVLRVNTATASQLLLQHSHDPLAALEAGYVLKLSSDASAKSARLPAKWSESGWQGVCAVCMEESPAAHFSVSMPCGHKCCDACWCGILFACLDDGNTLKACCPVPECRLPLPLGFIFQLLPTKQHARWLRLQAAHYVQCSPDAAWCPSPGCGRSLHLHTAANTTSIATTTTATTPTSSSSSDINTAPDITSMQQPPKDSTGPCLEHASYPQPKLTAKAQPRLSISAAEAWRAHWQRVLLLRWMYKSRGVGVQCMCGARFCFGCSAPVHEPASCRQAEAWQKLLQLEALTAESDTASFIAQNTKQCPKCRARVEKNGGCNHMNCACCKAQWCWACGEDWSIHSPATGGFYRCNRAAGRGASFTGSSQRQRRSGTRRAEIHLQRRIFLEVLPAFLHACEGRLTRIPAIAGRIAWLAGLLPESACTVPSSSSVPEGGKARHMQLVADFLQAWLDCISDCLHVLRWAHVLRFHTASAGACLTPSARYLEAMTARLVSATDQLLAPFERGIPHAALIPAQPLGESSEAQQRAAGEQGSQPEGLLSMLLSAAGLLSGGTTTTSTSSGSSSNSTTLVRIHARVQSAFKKFSGKGKHDHHSRQQQEQQQQQQQQQEKQQREKQQQEQSRAESDTDGREEDAHARVQTPQPPPRKCPLLVVAPPPSPSSYGGAQILEQLMYTIALLQEGCVATVRESMREAAFVSECLIQGGRAGCFHLPPEGPTPHPPLHAPAATVAHPSTLHTNTLHASGSGWWLAVGSAAVAGVVGMLSSLVNSLNGTTQ